MGLFPYRDMNDSDMDLGQARSTNTQAFTAVRRGYDTVVISWTVKYVSLPAGFRAVVITRVWKEVRKASGTFNNLH